MSKSILIVGAGGQVGRELAISKCPYTLVAFTRQNLDITNPAQIAGVFEHHRPGLVINAAAYTRVDLAETERAAAFAVNRDAVAELARACQRIEVPLLHVSTDYVFDGTKKGAYLEDDAIAPLNVYGKSKAAGEIALQTTLAQHIILRTSWVFSANGQNFVKTMLNQAQSRNELNVLDDQYGCPTSAASIAAVLIEIATRYLSGQELLWGVYHYSNLSPTTWYGFAREIFRQAGILDRLQVNPITSEEYPTAAQRPQNSVLDCSKIVEVLGIEPRLWTDELSAVKGFFAERY